jgi:uncharacterized membrane protein
MVENLVNALTDSLNGKIPKEMIIFIISMMPILELRGGIIAAAILKIPVVKAVLICTLGNMIPVPFILWLITDIFDKLKQTKRLKPMVEKLEKKALSKSDKIQKYEFVGLILFVGIPLPGTGAWTGSLIAALLGVDVKKSIPAIIIGIALALVIMCTISYLIPWIVTTYF